MTPPRLTTLDHIGIAVEDLDLALRHYERSHGLRPIVREKVVEQGVEVAFLSLGDTEIELLTPLDRSKDTPLERFLKKRGPGLHHLAYRVTNIEGALKHFGARGVTLIDSIPRRGSRNSLIAFLHPKDMGGVLTELVEVDHDATQ